MLVNVMTCNICLLKGAFSEYLKIWFFKWQSQELTNQMKKIV